MRLKHGAVAAESPWMDRFQAAGYLGLSLRSIDRLTARGELIKRAACGQVRFLRTDLDNVFKPCVGPIK